MRILAVVVLSGSIAFSATAAPILTQAEVTIHDGVAFNSFLESDSAGCNLTSPAPVTNVMCADQLSLLGSYSAIASATATLSSPGPDIGFSYSAQLAADSSAVFPWQASANAAAVLVVGFTLDLAATWEISSSSYNIVDTGLPNITFITLNRIEDDSFPIDIKPVCCSGSFDGTGALSPGTYRLLARLNVLTSGNQSEQGQWGFNFRVIPEPRTLALLFIATLPFGAVFRR